MPCKPEDFAISFVDLDADWDELMLAFWTSWKSPMQASGELTFPHLGTNTQQEVTALDIVKESLLEEAQDHRDAIHWVKATDAKTGRLVGAVCYKHEKKWPREGTNFTGCGFEPGTERKELPDSFYRQLLAWRLEYMKGEHMYGQAMFVLPDYRSTGVADMMLTFCLEEIDKTGLDVCLEGTVFSTPGLLRQGFIVVGWTNMIFSRRSASNDWKQLVHDLQAHPISIMWRPRYGMYVEGETVLPWTGKARQAKL